MSHNITNIEGFESNVGMQYFATDRLAPGFGGIVGTIQTPNSILPHVGSHDWSLFTFGQGWQYLPLAYSTAGVARINPIYQRAVMLRVRYQPFIAGPGPLQSIIAMGDFTAGPVIHTRVELDAGMRLLVDGVLGPAPTVLALDTTYFLEYFYDVFNGIRELRINGVPEYAVVGPGPISVDFLQLGDERVGRTAGAKYDDVLILADRVNPLPPMFPGDGEVHRLYATGVGALDEWNLGAGPNKTAAVSEIFVDGDATYITNPANPDRHQTFTIDPVSGIIGGGQDIKAIKVGTISRRVAGNPSWHHVALQSGATFDETIIDVWPVGAYANRGSKVYEEDPDTGIDWTVPAADAIEAGLGIHNVHNGRCTNLYVQVDFGPPFAPHGRAKINPLSLGPHGPAMINPPWMGG